MRTVTKTYKYKLYQSKRNKHLSDSVDLAAEIWNYCIAAHRCYYRLYGKSLSANTLKKHITKIKKRRYKRWNALNSQAIQDVVERVDRSYKAFFEHRKQGRSGKKSPPSFKKKDRYSSFTLKQCGYSFQDSTNHVKIQGYEYKFWKSREIEGTIKTVTVKRTKLGEYFLFVVTVQEVNSVLPRAGKAAGLDFGLKHFLTFDDGKAINSPEWYKHALKELRAAHRAVSRCKDGSNNRGRALMRLERLHEKVANARRDWFFKLAHELTSEYAILCMEDLDLKSMQRKWGRKASDVAGTEFLSILKWVAENNGCTVVQIGRWEPSTKTCHVCGGRKDDLTLRDREWDCPHCDTHLDRDVNAAINIKRIGLQMLQSAS